MYLNRWKPGQPPEFNEHLSVPNAWEICRDGDKLLFGISPELCPVSQSTHTTSFRQIHNWVYQSHICLRNVTTAQIKLLMHITTHRHTTELQPWSEVLETFPAERRTGTGLWMWHRQSWLLIPSSTTYFSRISRQVPSTQDLRLHNSDEQTAAGGDQDWDIRIWLKVLCFCPERPSFRGVNVHPRSTMHRLRWLLQ